MNKFELFKKTFAIPLISFMFFLISSFLPIYSEIGFDYSANFYYSERTLFWFISSSRAFNNIYPSWHSILVLLQFSFLQLSFVLLLFFIFKFINYSKFPSYKEAEHYYKELKRVKLLERAQKEKIEKELATRNYELKMKELEERRKKVL
jgi:hypothetical protein